MPAKAPKKRRIVLCLDGTWNSTYAKATREDGTNIAKPSNVLKLARAVLPIASDGATQIVYYDTGIGGEVDSEGGWKLFTNYKKKKEGMWGLGFNANVEQAVTFLVNNYNPNGGDDVFFYGFSRGAATARAIVKLIDWMGGLPTKRDAFYIPEFFEAYRKSKSRKPCEQVKKERGLFIGKGANRRARFEDFLPVSIKMLGVWDTVYALGGQMVSVASGGFHVDKIPPKIVENAWHALALDESRGSFAPAVWTGKHGHQVMVQMWFPGVHSNVGGGYVRDGMANVPLKWLIEGSRALGLDFDDVYLEPYRPYEFDRLYKSKTLGYKVMDKVLSKESGRNFLTFSDATNQNFHPSILSRMLATKADLRVTGEHKKPDYQLGLYEPEVIREMLTRQPDAFQYCSAWYTKEWYPGDSRALDDRALGRISRLVKSRLGLT